MAYGVGVVSPVEIASLVQQYLQDNGFVRSYEAFRYDAKALLADVPVRPPVTHKRKLCLSSLIKHSGCCDPIIEKCYLLGNAM